MGPYKKCLTAPCALFLTSTLFVLEICYTCRSSYIADSCRLQMSTNGMILRNRCVGNQDLDYSFRNLQSLPDNMCDFPGITAIRLTGNQILDLPNLSCLSGLATLELSKNKLTSLKAISLTGNRKLMYVDLSFNHITYIETGVLELSTFHTISLKGNFLISLDVRDLVITRPFGLIDISNNQVEIIVNSEDWKVNLSATYGPGYIDGTYNNIRELPNWEKIGFPNLLYLGKILNFALDFRHNPISCDCQMAQPLAYFKPLAYVIDRDYFNITCETPKALHGNLVRPFLEKNRISQLICNYTGFAMCPERCSCVKRPKYTHSNYGALTFTLSINCTRANIHRLPRILPESDQIEFYLQGNILRSITKQHYLSRVTVLELSAMPTFENGSLESMIRLRIFFIPSLQQLKGISREFEFFHPCVFLQKDNFIVNCTCSHLWMHEWLMTNSPVNCRSNFTFKCISRAGTENMFTYLPEMDCSEKSNKFVLIWSLSIIAICFASLFVTVQMWKYEIQLACRMFNKCKRSQCGGNLARDCVMFVSCDGGNYDIHSWVFKTLEPFLITKGFYVFLPARDLPFGSVRCEEIAREISASNCYIVILSVNYLEECSFDTRNEWRLIWNVFVSDKRKRLFVINYDLLKKSSVSCRKMRAVLRATNVVDFSAGENIIISKLSETFDS